jgi:hypothetical protein
VGLADADGRSKDNAHLESNFASGVILIEWRRAATARSVQRRAQPSLAGLFLVHDLKRALSGIQLVKIRHFQNPIPVAILGEISFGDRDRDHK